MKLVDGRRRSRPRRPLPFGGPESAPGPRSLFCVDLRAVETAWAQRPIQEIRYASRGGRLGWILSGLDVDPLRTLQRNARALQPERARQLYDALCEELADAVLHDVPFPVCRALLPLLAPHGSGECPYPADGTLPQGAAGGLVIVTDGRLAAEASALALGRAVYPPDGEAIDQALWSDVLSSLLPMLEAIRDRSRCLLIEA